MSDAFRKNVGIRTEPYRRFILRGTPEEINQIASHDLLQFAHRAKVDHNSGTKWTSARYAEGK